jgi:hypothetical protein
MAQFIALLIVGFTLPLWGGALAAVIGGGFYLLMTNPILFLIVVALLFAIGVFFSR